MSNLKSNFFNKYLSVLLSAVITGPALFQPVHCIDKKLNYVIIKNKKDNPSIMSKIKKWCNKHYVVSGVVGISILNLALIGTKNWSTKNCMVFCKLFESELQKLIDHKDYSLDGINFLWKIYNENHDKMKRELADDKTAFLNNLCKNLLRTYGLKFRQQHNNEIFEEKVQRLHNYLKDLYPTKQFQYSTN